MPDKRVKTVYEILKGIVYIKENGPADELTSPSAEHLEEPSIVATRETEQVDGGENIRIS